MAYPIPSATSMTLSDLEGHLLFGTFLTPIPLKI